MYIFKQINMAHLYYIGLDDRRTEGRFKWTDGTELDYKFWAPNEPNNWGWGEDCGVLNYFKGRAGVWNDWGCSPSEYYICKKLKPECP